MSEFDNLKKLANAFVDPEVSEDEFLNLLNKEFGVKIPKPRKTKAPKEVVRKARRGIGSY